MVATVVKYSDGGKVVMPKPAPIQQRPLPPPERGKKPERVRTNPKPRPRAYKDGGSVTRGPRKPTPQTPPPRPSTRDTIPAPKPRDPADAVRNQTARKMQLLGLKNGGKVRRR